MNILAYSEFSQVAASRLRAAMGVRPGEPAMAGSSKILEILRLFTTEAPVWRVDRIARSIKVSPSTAYRYVAQLVAAGLLDPVAGGSYVLGPAIIEYDRRIRSSDPLLAVALPVMAGLRDEFGVQAAIALARCYRDSALYLHCERGAGAVEGDYERGRPLALFRGASSIAMLAMLPDRALRRLHQRHANEIEAAGLGATQREFSAMLRQVRRTGWSTALAEPAAGHRAVAASITLGHAVIGAIALAMPERLIRSNLLAMGERVRLAADEIASQLEQRGPTTEHVVGRRPPIPGKLEPRALAAA
jgi:DNA-binding IclR family transcriptional regulator